MPEQSSHEQLVRLHEIILKERECAKALAMDEMMAVTKEKEELIRTMPPLKNLNHTDRSFAEKIQAENRRNAYLFWSTLNWIRETMEFFGRQTVPAGYTAGGYITKNSGGGRLLSGKV